MKKPAALIFDVDGTLAETEEAHREAFNRAFAEFGLEWNWDRDLYRRLLRVSGGKERIRAFAGEGIEDRLIKALHGRKTEIYTEEVAKGGVPFRPGIRSLIGDARQAGIRLAVATTTTRANVVALLDGAAPGEGRAWFELLATADEVPVKKPAPDVYRYVLDKMGLAPGACLALEDSGNGVRAAGQAGVPVAVSESVYFAGDDFQGALAVYPDFGGISLADLIEDWRRSNG